MPTIMRQVKDGIRESMREKGHNPKFHFSHYALRGLSDPNKALLECKNCSRKGYVHILSINDDVIDVYGDALLHRCDAVK